MKSFIFVQLLNRSGSCPDFPPIDARSSESFKVFNRGKLQRTARLWDPSSRVTLRSRLFRYLSPFRINESGITLIEIIIVIAIAMSLLAMIMLNFLNVRTGSSLSGSVSTILVDLKNQQIKAMTGDTEGRGVPDYYGIYFYSDRYVLFHGTIFNDSSPENFVVQSENGLVFSTTLPSSTIIFQPSDGEVNGYVNGQNTITISNPTTTEQKQLQLNKFGALTVIN